MASIDDGFDDAIAPIGVGVSNVELHVGRARDAVDGARIQVADAYGRDRVDRAGGFSSLLDCKGNFGGGEKRVVSIRHQYSAGVTAFPSDGNAQAGRSRDVRDDADGDRMAFEEWTLLDVKLDEMRIAAVGQHDV